MKVAIDMPMPSVFQFGAAKTMWEFITKCYAPFHWLKLVVGQLDLV